jgi:hypothetical protein
LAAIENAIAATADPAERPRYVDLAGIIPGDRVVPFLLTQIAPDVSLAARMRAADALLARGRDEGLWLLVDTWEHIDRDRSRTDEDARLLEFLVRTGNPRVIDLLGRMSGFSADVRFAIVQLFLPPPVWGQWEARAEWKLRCASLHGCTSRLHAGLAWNNETFRGPSEAEVRCSLVYRQGGGQECATQYRSNADDGARRDRGNRVGRLSRRRGGAGFFGRCSRRPRSFRR